MRSDLKIRTTVNSTVSAPPPDALENVLDSASPCCASNKSNCFKENININKSETPNLSLEPFQMKRKKKGGGSNLRKSLAWNRAFFTEEGVLDPLELSLITGASCREGLSFIDEDTGGGSLLPMKLENDIVKELQEEDLSKDRKKDLSSSKLDSSSSNSTTSTSLTPNKVPTRGGTKPGSRFSDCPRPLPSSSLKRPAMVNVGKAAGKDLKLPKVPGSKPSISSICGTTRSTILRANCVKHNQITTPSGSKSFSKSLKNTQNESKASSLRATHYSDGNSDNSSFRRHSSVNTSPLLVQKANNSGSEMISSSLTAAKPVNSSEGQRESLNFATPRNAHVRDMTIPSHNQVMKPSGLRMPSPSLSFFSQPKPSVFCDLSSRDTEADVRGSRKPENPRLHDSFRRTPKTDNKIPESITSVSRAINFRSECIVSPQVSAADILRPDLDPNSVQKGAVKVLYDVPNPEPIGYKLFEDNSYVFDAQMQDLPKETRIGRVSHKEAKLQKIDIEMPSESGRREQMMDDSIFPELRLEQKYAIHESETTGAIDDAPKEKNMCNSLVLNHGAVIGTQCEDALHHKVQNSKLDCREPRKEQTDPFEYCLDKTDMNTDKDKYVLKSNDRASEQLGVSKLNRSSCSRSASSEASEHSGPMAESTYSGSKHLDADLLKEASFVEVLADGLREGETHMQNAVFASTVRGCKSKSNLVSEVGKDLVVQDTCLKVEMELQGSIELNTTDGLPLEKQTCLQNSQQEENVLSIFLDRKHGNKVIDTQMTSSKSPHEMHDSEFDKDKMISQPLICTEFDYVGNPVSCESPTSLINSTSNHEAKHKGIITNDSFSGHANENLPDSLHQGSTRRTEIDYCSSFTESTTGEVSQKNTSRKTAEVGPIIVDGSASNWSTSSMSVKECESDMDNFTNIQDSGTALVQSPDSNTLTECCSNQSELLASPTAEFVDEKLVHSDERLHVENYLQTESPADVSYEDNALEIPEDSVTGQKQICSSILRSSSVSENEAVSAPNNELGVGLNERSSLLVPPQNAVPFSDEWLAAIEAAGEDILTRKGGAVQNSPPDKSLPEPSPWSPVRKKNNQIGPFDCTKYNNVDPSDS
ncbi:hypothetical protein ABFX02_14G250300 [Erythranthe guttata]